MSRQNNKPPFSLARYCRFSIKNLVSNVHIAGAHQVPRVRINRYIYLLPAPSGTLHWSIRLGGLHEGETLPSVLTMSIALCRQHVSPLRSPIHTLVRLVAASSVLELPTPSSFSIASDIIAIHRNVSVVAPVSSTGIPRQKL